MTSALYATITPPFTSFPVRQRSRAASTALDRCGQPARDREQDGRVEVLVGQE